MRTAVAKPLLTGNGLPPQVVAKLGQHEMTALLQRTRAGNRNPGYGADYIETHSLAKPTNQFPRDVQRFQLTMAKLTGAFIDWGAKSTGFEGIIVRGDALGINDTSVRSSKGLHPDEGNGIRRLKEKNLLLLRLIAPTSIPADFLDFTDRPDALDLCTEHLHAIPTRSDDDEERFYYDPKLRELAVAEGRIIRPDPGEIMLFDGITPHESQLSTKAHWRGLLLGHNELKLPSDWLPRVRRGDVPKLAF